MLLSDTQNRLSNKDSCFECVIDLLCLSYPRAREVYLRRKLMLLFHLHTHAYKFVRSRQVFSLKLCIKFTFPHVRYIPRQSQPS